MKLGEQMERKKRRALREEDEGKEKILTSENQPSGLTLCGSSQLTSCETGVQTPQSSATTADSLPSGTQTTQDHTAVPSEPRSTAARASTLVADPSALLIESINSTPSPSVGSQEKSYTGATPSNYTNPRPWS